MRFRAATAPVSAVDNSRSIAESGQVMLDDSINNKIYGKKPHY
jgi:hypothetical protein